MRRDLSDEVMAVAREVCSPAELEALEAEQRGLSQRAIGYLLGIDRSTVRDRLERAGRKVEAAMMEVDG